MDANKAVAGMGIGLAVLVLISGWQAWTVIGLQARVAALEGEPGTAEVVASAAATTPTRQVAPEQSAGAGTAGVTKAMQDWRDARQGKGELGEDAAATLVEEAVEEVLDEALDRHAEAREDEQRAKQRELITQSVEMIVEDLRDAHGFSADAEEELVEMFVGGIELGERLRKELTDGDLTVREATEEGRQARVRWHKRTLELIGEEATAALGDKVFQGQGWRLEE